MPSACSPQAPAATRALFFALSALALVLLVAAPSLASESGGKSELPPPREPAREASAREPADGDASSAASSADAAPPAPDVEHGPAARDLLEQLATSPVEESEAGVPTGAKEAAPSPTPLPTEPSFTPPPATGPSEGGEVDAGTERPSAPPAAPRATPAGAETSEALRVRAGRFRTPAIPEDRDNASVPLRDLVSISGVRDNQLVGYGLVVGLNGSGDGTQARFTIQSLANALQRMGVVVPPAAIRVRNAAAVMVTTDLPGFSQPGVRLDVNVASIGDAKSLSGGTLLMTPLKGPDGRVYALAQGPVSLGGGFSASGGGASVQKNHPTTGTVPAGALVERSVEVDLRERDVLELQLRRPDIDTAYRIERALQRAFHPEAARAVSPGRVLMKVPPTLRHRPMELLAMTLNVKVQPIVPARVVMNERTGTVVLGGDVRLSASSITHGNLTISIARFADVSQPAPFSEGQTVVTPRGDVATAEEEASSLSVAEGSRVSDLVSSLNKMGVTPRDMIAILEALRASGALHAELVVI